MKKIIQSGILFVVLCLLMPINVFAKTPLFRDEAHLVRKNDAVEISKKLEHIRKKTGQSVVIVTQKTIGDTAPEDYADTYFDENDFGPDGILLLIVKDKRVWQISTAGKGIAAFTDAGQDFLMGEALPELKKGKYGEAFKIYADWTEKFLLEAEKGKPFDTGHMPKKFPGLKWFLTDFLIGFALFGIIAKVKASQMITIRAQMDAEEYEKPGTMVIGTRSDYFVRKSTTSRRIERASTGSSTRDSGHGGSGGSF